MNGGDDAAGEIVAGAWPTVVGTIEGSGSNTEEVEVGSLGAGGGAASLMIGSS